MLILIKCKYCNILSYCLWEGPSGVWEDNANIVIIYYLKYHPVVHPLQYTLWSLHCTALAGFSLLSPSMITSLKFEGKNHSFKGDSDHLLDICVTCTYDGSYQYLWSCQWSCKNLYVYDKGDMGVGRCLNKINIINQCLDKAGSDLFPFS